MAGIGFKLRRFTEDETLGGFFKGYLGASLLCSGPWILTALTLLLIDLVVARNSWVPMRAATEHTHLFNAIVVYTYAFSLILTAPICNAVTRYLADRIYQGRVDCHLSTLVGVFVLLNPLTLALGAGFFAFKPLAWGVKLLAVLLFVLVCDIWVAVVFLGAVRAYRSVVAAFGAGLVTTLVCLVWLMLSREATTARLLMTFVAGQGVVLLALFHVIYREFDLVHPWDFQWLDYMRKFPFLPLAGLALNLGTWIGVLVYWSSPLASHIGGLAYYPLHDVALYLGLLSVIPAMTLFFVRTETEFYEGYRTFFGGITHGKARYSELQTHKAEMILSLRRGLADLLKVQGLITLTLIFYAPYWLKAMGLGGDLVPVTRACLLGAFLLVLAQFTVMIQYYYMAYADAFGTACFLLVGNAVTSWLSLSWAPSQHGWGLAVGSLPALLFGAWRLHELISRLEYLTFTLQPMPGSLRGLPAREAFSKTIRKDGKWLIDEPA